LLYQKIHIRQQQGDKFCRGAGIWAEIWAGAQNLVGKSAKIPIDSQY
jgi:hypothetical protein